MTIFKKTCALNESHKCVSFQYKLIHRAALLNDRLFHMGMVKLQKCSFRLCDKEDYEHFFYKCKIIETVWDKICAYYLIPTNLPTFEILC